MDASSKIDPKALRRVMGSFATGVTVITTATGKAMYGCTVNSFTSVSLDPPLILFCIHNESGLKQAILESQNFAVNILAADQEYISSRFADYKIPPEERFYGIEFDTSNFWSPIVKGSLASLDCLLHATYDGGDHTIVVGQVQDMKSTESSDPLMYFAGSYRELAHL